MIKIAISGYAGSGKNTIASLIASNILHLNTDEYRIVAFANKIKKIIAEMFPGCDLNALYGASELRQNKIISELNQFIETDVSFRDVSIDIGKLGRSYNHWFWISHIINDFNKLSDNVKLFIVSDLRFCDEFEWLKNNGFLLGRVKRDKIFKINDISETDQNRLSDEMFDFIVDNNCDLVQLQKQLVIILDRHLSNNMTYLQIKNAI